MSSEREIIEHLYERNYNVSMLIIDKQDRSERRTFSVEASNEQEAIRLAKRMANPRNLRGIMLRDIRIVN